MMKPNGIRIESKDMNTIEHIDGRGGTSVGPHLPASCIMHGVLLDSSNAGGSRAHRLPPLAPTTSPSSPTYHYDKSFDGAASQGL